LAVHLWVVPVVYRLPAHRLLPE